MRVTIARHSLSGRPTRDTGAVVGDGPVSFRDSADARLSAILELAYIGIIDTREAALLMGCAPEAAPPAGQYMERPACSCDCGGDDQGHQ